MASPRTHVLPVPLATSITFSLFSALINLSTLSVSGSGRVRDLRILRLVRRVAGQFDWNLLAHVPAWVHTERDLRSVAECALLFVCAAIASFAVLFPLAILFRLIARRLARKPAAMSVALLSMPALGLAVGGVLSPAMNALASLLAGAIVFVIGSRMAPDALNRW